MTEKFLVRYYTRNPRTGQKMTSQKILTATTALEAKTEALTGIKHHGPIQVYQLVERFEENS